ncbi:MAG: isopentenyl phosphate kinase [Bellilinea sp.]
MITFLKLGGSLITDKSTPRTADMDVIHRLAVEIRTAQKDLPELRLVLGHGSGSFGHVPAREYNTRKGVQTASDWNGFLEVWRQARDLNQIMIEALTQAGIPIIAFPPSAIIQAADGQPVSVQSEPLLSALNAGLTPLVAGDVIFDKVRGGTIFSTEDVFKALAAANPPGQVLICGKESGVWEDYPANTRLTPKITPSSYEQLQRSLGNSAGIDVTGGMRTKVEQLINLVKRYPQTSAVIFSGSQPGALYEVLVGRPHGTVIAKT